MVGSAADRAQAAFGGACRRVVAHLKAEVPLACWSVSRVDGANQVHEWFDDDFYGISRGHSRPWSETFCRHMVDGLAPELAPDAMAVPRYAAAAAAAGLQIRSYAGVPIRDDSGALYGTLCGFDPEARDDDLLRHGPLLHLMADLIGRLVDGERRRDEVLVTVDELRWAALHDPLTGLTARPVFLDELDGAVGRAAAAGPRPALVVLSPGVLAAVEEEHGPAAGDRLLVEVGERLTKALHPFDAVSRLEGEEFAVLLHDAADADATAARVGEALRAPVLLGDAVVPLLPSAGLAVADGAGPDELLNRARGARGRAGGWTVHDPAADPGVPALRAALRSGAVQPAYQPLVRLADDRVIAFEALARWTHEGTAVAPDVFVPLAGRAGLLPDLTHRMIGAAAARLAGWSAEPGARELQVGVNVPPLMLLDPAFPDRVGEVVERYGLGPRQLVLEITEDALLDDLPAARSVADRLRALGVALCLDDVGSGWSSLLHLRHLPLDAVKIDRVFVEDVDTSAESRAFLGAVLTCCHDLGLGTVAEGVERAAQLDVLRSLGAGFAQGYHLGRPVPPEEVDLRRIR